MDLAILHAIWFDCPELPDTAHKLLLALAYHGNPCWPSVERLATKYHLLSIYQLSYLDTLDFIVFLGPSISSSGSSQIGQKPPVSHRYRNGPQKVHNTTPTITTTARRLRRSRRTLRTRQKAKRLQATTPTSASASPL
jgi:hypothetical protein